MSSGAGKRRYKRIATALPVRLWGMDARGRPFIEVSKAENVSRTGVLLRGVPAKLAVGDIIGLRCQEKKYQFRVIWTGAEGSSEAGSVGLQSLDPGKWIWDNLRLPLDAVDIYTRPPECERRLLDRAKCFLSAEVLCNRAAKRVLAFATDISLGGCYIAMTYPFALETTVSIALWLDEQHKIWVDGIVVSSHPQTGMGVKFLDLSRRNLEAVERCMKDLSRPEMSSPLLGRG
jgi:PilZ domain